jgi:hypothetical protein
VREEAIAYQAVVMMKSGDQSFDEIVFGKSPPQILQLGNGRQTNQVAPPCAEEFRKRMEDFVVIEIQCLDRKLGLTEGQKKKLQLAARGDIADHIYRAEELRPMLAECPLERAQCVLLWREIQPLRLTLVAGVVSEQSLFWKTLQRALTDEQRVRFHELERERQTQIIEKAMLHWESHQQRLVLTGETKRKFIDVILDHGRLPLGVGAFGEYVVLLEADQLRDRLQPLLSDAEWTRLDFHIGLAQREEPRLKVYGIWRNRLDSADGIGGINEKKELQP